ncbi:hypothetical protein BDQ17DRAFT_1547180 [Cyathus striatus]|nr:hypothetical protein BDQ17DRAFT_1547180 [Cyathus striatus]
MALTQSPRGEYQCCYPSVAPPPSPSLPPFGLLTPLSDSLPAPAPSSLTTDLRHMTSLSALSTPAHAGSRRTSQHIGRARSPGSIPSSPTSIKSIDIHPAQQSSNATLNLCILTHSHHPLRQGSSIKIWTMQFRLFGRCRVDLTSRDNEDWVGLFLPSWEWATWAGVEFGMGKSDRKYPKSKSFPIPRSPAYTYFYPNSPGNSTLSPLSYPPSLSPPHRPRLRHHYHQPPPHSLSLELKQQTPLVLSYADLLLNAGWRTALSSLTCAREEAAVHLPALRGWGCLADGGVLGSGSPQKAAHLAFSHAKTENETERERESMLFLDGIGMGVGGEWEREGWGGGWRRGWRGCFRFCVLRSRLLFEYVLRLSVLLSPSSRPFLRICSSDHPFAFHGFNMFISLSFFTSLSSSSI